MPSRRVFLKTTTTVAAVSLCGGCAGAPKTTAAPQDGAIRLAFADHPDLQQPGGSLSVEVEGLDDTILVFNRGEAGYAAVSQKCPHLGCKVGYETDTDDLKCPCHGSRFTADGEKTKGPAKTGLSAYSVVSDTEAVTVTLPA